jgi:hypothetical protein
MNREDIIRMAQESKLYSGKPRTPATGRMIEKRLKHFAALVVEREREARDQALTITQDEIAQGVADRDAERAELRAEIMANLRLNGWRQCAAGQKTTQFCGLLEEAVKAEREKEREACIEVLLSNFDIEDEDVFNVAAAIRARGESK